MTDPLTPDAPPPPAPALGALDAQTLARLHNDVQFKMRPYAVDFRALLAAYDAQAARLAAMRWSEKLEAEHRALTARLAELSREMDAGVQGILRLAVLLGVTDDLMGDGPWPPWEVLERKVQAQAAQLAVVEQALALAITHIDGKAAKFSEREPVAVLQQLRAALESPHANRRPST